MAENMSDRELLELAAKAYLDKSWHCNEAYMRGFMATWNPLDDDGDALRLAVALGLDVTIDNGRSHTWADTQSMPGGALVKELHGNDALASTRRAIVRSAAEIGRQM